MFMHKVPVPAHNHTPHQAFPSRRPHLLQFAEGGYHGDLDTRGQNNFVRVRETVAVATIEATAEKRSARGGKSNQAVAMERGQHQPSDLVDIW